MNNYENNPGMALSQTGTINVDGNPPIVKSSEYEKALSCVISEIERLDLHIEYLTKHLNKVIPNELAVEMPLEARKMNNVPLLADMERIKDRIEVATNRILFLNEHIVL